MPGRTDAHSASEAPVTGRQTTILESLAMGAGIVVVGLSYVAGVISPAGITITAGIVLILSAVMFIVAAWLGDRTDKRLRTILYAIDRNERDRIAEYGAIMRKAESHAAASHDRLDTACNGVLLLIQRQAEDQAAMGKLTGLLHEIADSIAKDARILTVLAETEERGICKASRDAEAIRAAIDGLGETFASELLAINGAMNGLRSEIGDVLKHAAGSRPMPPIRTGPESDDPIAELIHYKTESGDLWVTSATGAIVAGDNVETDADQ